jgi:cobaltochelatase CobT
MKFWRSLFGQAKPMSTPTSATIDAPEKPADRYKIYTTEFDKEIRATDLGDLFEPLSPSEQVSYDLAWKAFQRGMHAWRTTAQIRALDISSELRVTIPPERLKDTVVTLLVDHSGSMRGQSTLLAAGAMDVAHDFLVHLGCSVEILGFTTSSWKGGRSRRIWANSGRPANPGRLCDLLHIVYVPAVDEHSRVSAWTLKPMLRPDLLKENVDGEALLWAAGRLQALPHRHKLLIVISDGAPVDDSTLLQNGKDYLDRHLRQVISELETGSTLTIAAIGIAHDISGHYRLGKTINTPMDLGTALLDVIKDALLTTKVVIYHNPDCGTSRDTLALIRHAGIEPVVVEYLTSPPSRRQLAKMITDAGLTAREAIREKEALFHESGLDNPALNDDQLLGAMLAHPVLINRPFVISPLGARLCRSPEAVLDILPAAGFTGAFTKEDGGSVLDENGKRMI